MTATNIERVARPRFGIALVIAGPLVALAVVLMEAYGGSWLLTALGNPTVSKGVGAAITVAGLALAWVVGALVTRRGLTGSGWASGAVGWLAAFGIVLVGSLLLVLAGWALGINVQQSSY